MKKANKYQLGGSQPSDRLEEAIKAGIVIVPEEYQDLFQHIMPQQQARQQEKMPFSFMPQPGSVSRTNVAKPKGNVQNILENGWSITPNEKGAMLERETGNVQENRYFAGFNQLAQGVTGIANKFNDIRNDRKQRQDYIKAMQQRNYENFNEEGLNDLPMYYQLGGDVQYPYGGGPLTAEGAKEILRDGKVNGKKLTKKQKGYFGYIAGGGKPKKQTGGEVSPTAELENGEIYEDTAGGLSKIPDSQNTHEQGGVEITDAERVLEDTSDKRKDKASKALLIDPDRAFSLTGFKPKSALSHSKLLEKASEHYEGEVKKFEFKLRNSVDNIKSNPIDKFASNSMDLNLKEMNKIPTSGELFDILFGHQEVIKRAAAIEQQSKYATGGNVDILPIDEYGKAKTAAGNRTPTGKSNKYSRGKEYLQRWEGRIPGITKWDNAKAQSAIYDYMLQTDEGKAELSAMWREFGLTNEGKKAKNKDLLAMTKGGVFDPNKELDDNQLTQLKRAYVDGFFGDRQIEPKETPKIPVPVEPVPLRDVPKVTPAPSPTPTVPEQRRPFNLKQNPKSRFNEPLRWFDVAGPIDSYLSSDRIPAKYDAPEFNQIRLALQNPLPTLQNAQTDYNTAIETLDPTTGFGAANTANLFSKKYAVDNQVISQYDNINNQIKNQEIQYNSQIRDRQSVSDVQARGQFEQKYLLGKEAQREQQLTSMDELYTRIAQNKRLNREGNLLMQLSPAFDQYAEFNGYQVPIRNPLEMSSNQSGNNVQYITDPQSGQKYRVIVGADGKPISSSKIVTDNKAVGATKGK